MAVHCSEILVWCLGVAAVIAHCPNPCHAVSHASTHCTTLSYSPTAMNSGDLLIKILGSVIDQNVDIGAHSPTLAKWKIMDVRVS